MESAPLTDKADCVLFGGGGHARVLIDSLGTMPTMPQCVILDVDASLHGEQVSGVPVLGDDGMLNDLCGRGIHQFIVAAVAIGDLRVKLFESAAGLGLTPYSVRHASALISATAHVGEGAQLLAGCIVNTGARIGANAIINSGAIIEHDCQIGDHAHVAPGACLAGAVQVARCAHVGIGAVVRECITIGEGAVVGAGAVVVKHVPAGAVVVGVPAGPLVPLAHAGKGRQGA